MRHLATIAGSVVLAGVLVSGLSCVPPGQAQPADPPKDKGAPGAPNDKGWGSVKGQIVFAGDKIPERIKVGIDKDVNHCASKGPILTDKWVVNPKSKGVRWAVVWLTTENNVRVSGKPPIHPDLAKSKNPEAYLDQPCCVYEPHVLVMRDDQTLVFKNSGAVPHNVKYDSAPPNPSGNPIIQPGGTEKASGPVSYAWTPIEASCSIHGWMKAYVRVYDHPYFAVTDEDGNFEIKNAPAGTYFLNVWHEDVGIHGAKTANVDGKRVTLAGQKVTITDGKETKVDPIGIKSDN
jgi:hypothetical protein